MRGDWTVSLYPRAWKRRYAAEMRFVLAEHTTTVRTHLDMLRGATDAWVQIATADLVKPSVIVVLAGVALNLALIGIQLAQYPLVFGQERIPYVLAAIAALIGFAGVAVVAGRASGPTARRDLRVASGLGVLAAAIMAIDIAREYLTDLPTPLKFLIGGLAFLAVLLLFGAAGAVVGRGDAAKGARAGAWAAIVTMLVLAPYAWILNSVLMARLEQILPTDPEFKIGNTLTDLPSYTVWNTIAAISSHAILLPILGAIFGATGAALVSLMRRRTQTSSAT
jgi:hypothetical protein